MADAPRYNSGSELDLAELLGRLISYFKKNFLVFTISCVLCVVIAYIFYKSMPKVYTARMVLQTSVLNVHEEMEIIDNWDQLLNKRGYPRLAKEFGCDLALVQAFESYKFVSIGPGSEE